jgi:hypothetical protein
LAVLFPKKIHPLQRGTKHSQGKVRETDPEAGYPEVLSVPPQAEGPGVKWGRIGVMVGVGVKEGAEVAVDEEELGSDALLQAKGKKADSTIKTQIKR